MTVQKRSLILHILHRWSDEMIRSKTIISEGKWWRSIAWSIAARRNSGIRAQQLTQNNRSSYFNPISPVTPSSQLTTLLSSTPIYHFQRASKTCLSFVKLRFTWLNMPSWLIPRHFTLCPLIFFPFLYHFHAPIYLSLSRVRIIVSFVRRSMTNQYPFHRRLYPIIIMHAIYAHKRIRHEHVFHAPSDRPLVAQQCTRIFRVYPCIERRPINPRFNQTKFKRIPSAI